MYSVEKQPMQSILKIYRCDEEADTEVQINSAFCESRIRHIRALKPCKKIVSKIKPMLNLKQCQPNSFGYTTQTRLYYPAVF